MRVKLVKKGKTGRGGFMLTGGAECGTRNPNQSRMRKCRWTHEILDDNGPKEGGHLVHNK